MCHTDVKVEMPSSPCTPSRSENEIFPFPIVGIRGRRVALVVVLILVPYLSVRACDVTTYILAILPIPMTMPIVLT